MTSTRKDYMRLYMRKYRAQKQGIEPSRTNHVACDKRIAELTAEIERLTEDNKKLREALPF